MTSIRYTPTFSAQAPGGPPVAESLPVTQRPAQARAVAAPRSAAPQRAATGGTGGYSAQGGTNPYNAAMPRYQGIGNDEIAWAQRALNERRPDGSFAFKESERNHAQKQIVDKMVQQDRELADPMSGASLRSRWGTMTDKFGRVMDGAAGQMDQYGSVYDALDADTGGRIGRMDTWNPDMQDGFDTSFLRDQRPTAQQGWTPGRLDAFDSAETRGFSPTALRGVNTNGLRAFNAGGTMQNYLAAGGGGNVQYDTSAQAGTSSYDPSSAVGEYARGAAAEAKYVLSDQLEAATNAAARSGRLNTGLFDRDKGSVIRRVGENLNSQIAQQAVSAAQIRAGIENTNSRNVTDANIAGLRERGQMATTNATLRSNEARDAARLGLDALDRATGYDVDIADSIDRLLLDRAGTIDKNALTAADATARYTLDQAQGIDDFNQKGAVAYGDLELKRRAGIDDSRYTARRDATDASIKRQGMGLDRLDLANRLWETAGTMTGDAISGERDRITGQENFNRILEQQKKQGKRDMWGNIISGVGTIGGAIVGGMVGGPAGAAVGASAGGKLGGR